MNNQNKIELIAEIGWNHCGDISLAEDMIYAAKEAGADYAKFQTWHVDSLKPGPWDLDGRRQIYEKAELTNERADLFKSFCNKAGIKFLTSCFSVQDLEYARRLSNEIKIPGAECGNKELVQEALKKFDRVFISTGSHKLEEYKIFAGELKVVMLHCVSSYPCPMDRINLPRFLYLKQISKNVGYSGHSPSHLDAIAAISLGASVIEKHFTVDKTLPGRDNHNSLLPYEFRKIRQYADSFNSMMIDHGVDFQECERENREVYSGRWGQ